MLKVVGNKLFFAGKTYSCAIGKNGFSADKKEGDGCSPIGIFPLRECWYRADRMSAPITKLPLKIITQNDGWCDDVNSEFYNQHIILPSPAGRGQGEGFPKLPLPLGEGRGEGIYQHTAAELIARARSLRQYSPTPEIKLWNVLRNRQMNGKKFRRQHPIEPYVADFYCEEIGLIIELDGESHFAEEGKKHDAIRSQFLEKSGYKILRFTNVEIKENFEGVVQSIYNLTSEEALTPTLSQREREQKEVLSQREREQKNIPSPLGRGQGEGFPRHEKLWREDGLYDIIIPLGYNDSPAVSGKGSAIFIHIAKPDYSGTEGCIALEKKDIVALLPNFSTQTCIEIGN